MRNSPLKGAALGLALATAFSLSAAHAVLVEHTILSNAGDGEVRQSSAGAYTTSQGTPEGHLRVGFQSSFGSDGQAAGGLGAVWFLKLPQLNLAAGESIESVNFVTTLMEESAGSPITPRFNADLYALGFVSTPALQADGIFFFAGQEQSGQTGLGAGQFIQKIDDDYFTVFTDFQSVNSQTPKKPKPVFTDETGRLNLAAYLQGIYENPFFPNTGTEYLVLRLSPDRAANETYQENGTQFYGKGTTRYRVASGTTSDLVSTAAVDYTDVVPTQLTLTLNQVPEPATLLLLGVGTMWLGNRRRRTSRV